MFKNYLKTAWRNLWKSKGFSVINIAGLAIGLASCLLILFYVADEWSYDKYNEHADRIYRVDADIKFGGDQMNLAVVADPMGAALKKDYPQVEQYVRLRNYGGFMVKKGNQNLPEDRVVYADSTLFDVFTLPMINGDPETALKAPNSIVITESISKKYFNTTDAVGKNLIIGDTSNYKVTGVIENIPAQSHFNFDFFVSLSSSEESRLNNWLGNNFNTYILLREGADPEKLEAQFPELLKRYIGPQLQQALNTSLEEFGKNGNYLHYELMPLSQIHLHSNKVAELGVNSNIQYVYIFSFIALLILLIACVNFMNLSTARSANRAKEVGVRKVLGSVRKNLIFQFLTESVLTCFISLLLAIGLVFMLLPYFNQLSGKQLSAAIFSLPWVLPLLAGLILIVGIIAGSYPAFFLSAFKPVEVLKGKLAKGFKGNWLLNGLVIFQFFISIALIIGTLVIFNQLKYMHSKNVGFNRNHVLVIKNTYSLDEQTKVFKNELMQLPGVQNVTMTGYLPTNDWSNNSPLFPDASLNPNTAISAQIWRIDENYIPTLGMQIKEGRNFSEKFPTDSSGIIINEAAAKLLGFTDPLNKTLYYFTGDWGLTDAEPFHIVGVLKNFNFNSLRQEITPLVFILREQRGSMALRMNTGNISGLIADIERKWKQMAPGQPFSYSFMEDDFNNIYKNDQRVGKIFSAFTLFAILIACLGLFGLVTYAAQQRTREIGIRKVLGASEWSVVSLLSKDFLKLIVFALLIALPVSWYAMNYWLQQFAYRITISWWIFFVATLIVLLIGVLTISLKAVSSARANPVDSLRSE